jgi:hypothetical protein
MTELAASVRRVVPSDEYAAERREGLDPLPEIVELDPPPVEGHPEYPDAPLIGDGKGADQDRATTPERPTVAPSPRARVRMPSREKPGLRRSCRKAWRKSAPKSRISEMPQLSRARSPSAACPPNFRAGLPRRFRGRHALTDQLLRLHLEMKGELLLELALHGGGTEDRAEAEEEIPEEAHGRLLRRERDDAADALGEADPVIGFTATCRWPAAVSA